MKDTSLRGTINRDAIRLQLAGQAAVNEIFLGILCVDLTQDICVRLRGRYIDGEGAESYSGAIRAVSQLMDPASASRYLDLLSIDALREKLRESEAYFFELEDIMLAGELSSIEFIIRRLPAREDGGLRCVYMARDVSEDRRREHESDMERRKLLTAIDRLYSMILSVNLSENTYAYVSRARLSAYGAPQAAGTVDGWVDTSEESLHPSFREEFRRRFNRLSLLQAAQEGEDEVYMEHMQRLGNDYRWTFTHVIFVDNPYNDDVLEMTLCNVIDERIRMEQQEREYSIGAGALYEGSEIIDLDTDEHTVMSARFAPFSGGLGKTQADRARFTEEYIYPDDREEFLATFDTAALRRLLHAEGDALVREVRVLHSGGWRWMSMRAQAFRDLYSLHLKCFFCFYDIDEVKRLQEERSLANLRFTAAVRDVYARMYEADMFTGEFWRYTIDGAEISRTELPEGWPSYIEHARRDRVHPDDLPDFLAAVGDQAYSAALSQGLTQTHVTYRIRQDASQPYVWCTLWLRVVRSNESAQRVLAYVQDVDADMREREKRIRALEEAQRAAEQANQAKSQFLSAISHDIRTPMNAIIGMAELARAAGSDTARVSECLARIDSASRHLLQLINDVLDMSAIESGRMTLSQSVFDLAEQMQALDALFGESARNKGVTFVSDSAGVTHSAVLGDPLRLKQVFINIVGNAVKFTPSGGRVTVRLTQLPSMSEGVGLYRFTCEDSGIGMSEDFVRRLYQPFERARTATVSGMEGTGLGMSIAHSIVKLLGGDIQVDSRVGEGTRFTVTIPLRQASGCAPARANAPDMYTLAGRRILVAEDNAINMEIASIMLAMAGAAVETAVNGQEAVDAFTRSAPFHYDAVLMDVQMPLLDGHAAARAIRALDRADARFVPIIAMTADAFAQDVRKALDAGMTAHIAKPIDRAALCEVLQKAIASGEQERAEG